MFVQNVLNAHQIPFVPSYDYAWLAGAARGLEVAPTIPVTYAEEILDLVMTLNVESVDPGRSYEMGDGISSPAYDVLGGYVSVTGRVTSEGLIFKIPETCRQLVQDLIPNASVSVDGLVTVPPTVCSWALAVLPLRGPVATNLMEVAI